MSLTRVQKRLVESAVQIAEVAPEELTFLHSTMCQTALPARRPPPEVTVWERRQGRAALLVEAGRAWHPTKKAYVQMPLPFGPKARLVIMHLNTEAVRHQSPVIEVERSLTAFVRRLQGSDPNGREIRTIKEQLAALSTATIRLTVDSGDAAMQINTQIVGALDLWPDDQDSRQRVLWPAMVRLSTDYYESLSRHAVPLDERAVAALAHSATALDAYAWLAQRLHRIPAGKRQFISWTALHEQFGQGFSRLRAFREYFLDVLRQVATQYPEARIEAVAAEGLYLETSPPPVLKRLVLLLPA